MPGVDDVLAHVHEETRQGAEEYRSGAPRPLAGYVAVLAVFAALVAAGIGVAVASGRRVPGRIRVRDLVLLTAGTHKLSRLLTKDPVTSPLRARSPGSRSPVDRPRSTRRFAGPASCATRSVRWSPVRSA